MSIARVSRYTFDAPAGWESESINVESTGQLVGGEFVADADVWAVRKRGWCLTDGGEWEFEPQPSSRDEEFFARCRFTLDEALGRAETEMRRWVSASANAIEEFEQRKRRWHATAMRQEGQ